jgi:small-conductance mechanosensitive channel
MKRRIITASLASLGWSIQLVFCFLVAVHPISAAQATSEISPASGVGGLAEESLSPGVVVIEGRTILTVYEPVGSFKPEERASAIAKRIISFAGGGGLPDAMRIHSRDAWSEIFVDNVLIMAVTEADAKIAGKPREQLATEDAESIRLAIHNYRRDHSWRFILRGLLDTGLCTLVLGLVLWLIRRTRFAVRRRVESRIHSCAHLQKKSGWQASVAYVGPVALALGGIARWLLILGLVQAYLTVSFGFFSSTREISVTVTKWVFSQLAQLGKSALDYLPNLLIIAVICLITYYAFQLLKLIAGEIRKGDLKINGFFPDWAEPTEKLVRMLVLVLALIVAFPYFPGAKSPAFQGVSIFLGVLLSLGSSSAVANIIAGVILTYMRSFLLGDWVHIGDITGEVVEKNLLVTRVLTPKAEIITIPNATVMSGAVKNYSSEAKKTGVIFHTTVTIGYDAAWRKVHQLLTSAALATEHVRHDPAPFVMQTRLDDFYVAYELNAYTDIPSEMLRIYSDLHQNIQDKFNEAAVEICSPHFSALRDGNVIALPEQYIKPEYERPGFRIDAELQEKSSSASGKVSAARRTG